MKKILLLSTGGTIASVASDAGLVPKETGEELIKMLGKLPYDIQVRDILQLDSSNIQPEEWKFIAENIYKYRNDYDGIVVSHGTDTMAYTASMLSFMLKNINIPVVLTGSQVPINVVLSDAHDNLRLAFAAAATCPPDVYLAFHNKVMLGCRSVKVRTTNFDAFESVNLPAVGTVSAAGLRLDQNAVPVLHGPFALREKCSDRVFLVKLTPGIRPEIFHWLADAGYRGIVVETFGAGGMAFLRRNLVECLGELTAKGIPVAAVSQCLYDGSDLSIYESGRMALQNGIWDARDMTTEAAVTKMMWCLGQETGNLRELFFTPRFGEISADR